MRRRQTIADAVKLRDIAQLTGVSASTVSRALNHPDKVASATLQRILKVVRDQNYEPNVVARGLRRRQSTMIGLVIADILNDFYATVAKGVQDTAMRRGFTVVLANTDEDSAREEQFLRESYQHQFAGLVIVPTSSSKRLLARFSRTPVVEVDRSSGRAGAHVVLADNASSTVAAIRHLARLGHARIATVSGNQSVTTGVERLQGFLDGMRQAGLPIDERWIVHALRHDEASGFTAMESLLALPPKRRPTAVFAFNNLITAGVLRSLRSASIQVPDQVSLIGFDDSRWAQLMTPSLTVIAQPAREMGVLAAERLFSLIANPGIPGTITRLATTLVLRESTAPPTS
jgi:LacI family transcriptional regulator, repressor for deo operon, udp, cdd, tsx, nupC, and nupG